MQTITAPETVAVPAGPLATRDAARRMDEKSVHMLTLVSPSGLQRFFEAVVREGEADLLADPERLAALAEAFGTEILGDYPGI
ncbi:hypothetical protein [Pseudonocardia nigra]|uniref:hypothetical protein n=1 Tax=Pseudonocardia nigra TaxID=1921578 RepID=UPI001C5CDD37|nr:hypothetical protein [Pseudonocardia nigra]